MLWHCVYTPCTRAGLRISKDEHFCQHQFETDRLCSGGMLDARYYRHAAHLYGRDEPIHCFLGAKAAWSRDQPIWHHVVLHESITPWTAGIPKRVSLPQWFMTRRIELRDKVISNLAAQGEAGAAWIRDLPEVVGRLEAEWEIRVGRTFPNATEAYVAEAASADGTEFALKIPIVGLAKGGREARLLQAAAGRGYVRLLRHDAASGAMLLERLGRQLAQQGLPVDEQIAIICATLERAWTLPERGLQLTTGVEKAGEMASYITSVWPKLGRPCSEKAIEVALRFAKSRADASDSATPVVSHGDAHAWNTLCDPATGDYKFVDPDGWFVERAHDLSISLREGCVEFLAGDPVELGGKRCALLTRLTRVDSAAIWQWGFVETLVNGLSYLEVGSAKNAAPFLSVADAWAAVEP
jgi:streptomycin 6-kinase